MTPFWIVTVAAIALAAIYVKESEASSVAKVLVVVLVALSLWLQLGAGSLTAWTAGRVIQAAVGVFALIPLKVGR